MQGKKFKDKALSQREANGSAVPESDLNFSDSDGGQPGKSDQFPISWLKRPSDGAGDGFVTSIRGLFNSQRRKAKAFVLRTMRGDADSEVHGEWSDSDVEYSPFARQLTITKAKRLMRHAKKFRSRGHKSSGEFILKITKIFIPEMLVYDIKLCSKFLFEKIILMRGIFCA